MLGHGQVRFGERTEETRRLERSVARLGPTPRGVVKGTREHAEALRDETSRVLSPIGLRLSEEKTRVCHIDEGFDFPGYRVQRRSWRGQPGKRAVYTYPSKKALASIMVTVRTITAREKHRTLG